MYIYTYTNWNRASATPKRRGGEGKTTETDGTTRGVIFGRDSLQRGQV